MTCHNSERLFSGQISIVTDVFPTPFFPERGAFNGNLAAEFAHQGLRTQVVSCEVFPRRWWEAVTRKAGVGWDCQNVSVGVAPFLGLGRWCPLPTRGRAALTIAFLRRAIEAAFARSATYPGIVYAIFAHNGVSCLPWCQRRGIPLFVELPESGIPVLLRTYGSRVLREMLAGCWGVVADSVDNRQFCLKLAPGCGAKVVYIPNGANLRRFTPIDRGEARRRLGLPERERIVVFCGHFIERKGPLRVLEALRLTGGVKGVFLGRGAQVPSGPLVLHAAPVPNEVLPVWMSAGDIFVLPSLAEGLANAIVEAMGCGLPVVVSDRSFNRSFLNEDCAVFVDPESAQAIAEGIQLLLADGVRRARMGANALQQSKALSMAGRVESIRGFIQSRLAAAPSG